MDTKTHGLTSAIVSPYILNVVVVQFFVTQIVFGFKRIVESGDTPRRLYFTFFFWPEILLSFLISRLFEDIGSLNEI